MLAPADMHDSMVYTGRTGLGVHSSGVAPTQLENALTNSENEIKPSAFLIGGRHAGVKSLNSSSVISAVPYKVQANMRKRAYVTSPFPSIDLEISQLCSDQK